MSQNARITIIKNLDDIELIEADFSRPRFTRHAHPTYALGVICWGVNHFHYRHAFHSAPKESICTVIPDEVHEVEPYDNKGFAYRCLYPSVTLLREAAESVQGKRQSGTLILPPVIHDEAYDSDNPRFSRQLSTERRRDSCNEKHYKFQGPPPALKQRRKEIEASLRQKHEGHDRAQLRRLPVIAAYEAHYRKFRKSYHVLLQLESVALKGKSLPDAPALVQAMFMTEISNLLLTAGHDLDKIADPLHLDAADGNETYETMRGAQATCKAGDMIIKDAEGVISSVLYGPDARTRLTDDTRNVLYTVYAPEAVDAALITRHLNEIADYVRIAAPDATTQLCEALR